MGSTLTHGVYLPDEGERNCYSGLASNWSILDGAVGTIAEHTTALAGKAPAVHTHVKADITDFPAFGTTAGTICEGNDSRLSDARTPVAHTHVTTDVTDLLNSGHTWTGNQTYSGLTKTSGKAEHKAAIGADLDDFILNMETYNWGTEQVNTPESYGSLLALNREGNTHSSPYDGWLNQIGFGTTGKLYHRYKVNVAGSWSVWRKIYTNWDNYIPGQNNTYDLGSFSYQWNNVYAKNYFYNGTAWGLDKANTWTGGNSFSKTLNIYNSDSAGTTPALHLKSSKSVRGTTSTSETDSQKIAVLDKNGNAVSENITYVYGAGSSWVVNAVYTTDSSDNVISSQISHYIYKDGRKALRSETNTDLGTSTSPWNNLYAKRVNTQTLNGINPGALSLPTTDTSKIAYFSGDITDLTGGLNSKSFAVDGWVTIFMPNVSGDYIAIDTSIGQVISISGTGVGDANIACICPVRAGITNRIFCKCSSSLTAAHVPCAGSI